MNILGGRTGGAVSVSNLVGWAGVCNGDSGGAVAVGCWAITLGSAGRFSLGSGWVFYCGMEYGGISCGGLGRKMLRMRVRASKRSVCSVAGTHDSLKRFLCVLEVGFPLLPSPAESQ